MNINYKFTFAELAQLKLYYIYGFILIHILVLIKPVYANERIEKMAQPYYCEDSVVTKVGYYFKDEPNSGIYITFKSTLGVSNFKGESAAVTDRMMPLNSVIAKQKVGNKVQVCLISTPSKERFCNPEKDSRGRFYRIYDYQLKAAYVGTNGNHLCGGA
jgi:hypothetical protein